MAIVGCTSLTICPGIIRIAPNKRTKQYLYGVVAFFGVIASVLVAQKVWVCDGSAGQSWKSQPVPSCPLGLQVSITELVSTSFPSLALAPFGWTSQADPETHS